MNAERSSRPRHLQDAGQVDPTAIPHHFLSAEASDDDPDDEIEDSGPPTTASRDTRPTRAALTGTQIYRARVAAGHLQALRGVDFMQAAPADQILWLDQLRGDVAQLLKILGMTTSGL